MPRKYSEKMLFFGSDKIQIFGIIVTTLYICMSVRLWVDETLFYPWNLYQSSWMCCLLLIGKGQFVNMIKLIDFIHVSTNV